MALLHSPVFGRVSGVQNGPLDLKGQVKELLAIVEHPVDLLLGDAMIHYIGKPDLATCFVELVTNLLAPLRMGRQQMSKVIQREWILPRASHPLDHQNQQKGWLILRWTL